MKILKPILVTLFLIGVYSNIYSQMNSPSVSWLANDSTAFYGDGKGENIAVDAYGNVYATGLGGKNFRNTTLPVTQTDEDVFVTKLGAGGSSGWAKSITCTDYIQTTGIAPDEMGNVYLTGFARDTCNFGGTTLIFPNPVFMYDIFIAKYGQNGDLVWVKQLGSTDNDISTALKLDADGNVYVSGSFSKTVTFGDSTFTAVGGMNAFISKMNPNGDFLWTRHLKAKASIETLAFDNQGNGLISGVFSDSINFDNSVLNITDPTKWGIYVAKLSSAGSFLWAKQVGSGKSFSIKGCGTDANNNIYIGGSFKDSVFLGNSYYYDHTGGYNEIFVYRLDSTGNHQWVRTSITSHFGGNSCGDMVVDASGNTFITGSFNGNMALGSNLVSTTASVWAVYVAKFDTSGNSQWVIQSKTTLTTSRSQGYGLDLDAENNCYVTGQLLTGATFGNLPAPQENTFNIFILKISGTEQETGIEEENSTYTEFILYPNPANNQLTIETENELNNATAVVMDIFGRVVLQDKLNAQQTIINTSNLNSGVYFLQINAGGKRMVKKFVKE